MASERRRLMKVEPAHRQAYTQILYSGSSSILCLAFPKPFGDRPATAKRRLFQVSAGRSKIALVQRTQNPLMILNRMLHVVNHRLLPSLLPKTAERPFRYKYFEAVWLC